MSSFIAYDQGIVVECIKGVQRVACGSGGCYFGDVRIVDPETCVEMPEGEEGEIWVSGPSAAIGYFGQKKESEKVFNAKLLSAESKPFVFGGDRRYVRTGDMGAWKGEYLFVCGKYILV